MTTVPSDDVTTFVAGDRTFEVRIARDKMPRSMRVTVTMDDGEWIFDEPGWRPMSFGTAYDIAYLWSARELIVLPRLSADHPEIVTVNEDLLRAFRVADGWLLVCETSVRRVIHSEETARLELGDVAEYITWEREYLLVRDAIGKEHRVRVQGDQLILSSAGEELDTE